MLERLFLQVLNLSFTGGIVILFVLVARLLLRKGSKAYSYALWSVVLFRLVCPFSFESELSLLPTNPESISQEILYAAVPRVETGVAVLDDVISAPLPAANLAGSINPMQVLMWLGAGIWLVGILALLLYSLITLGMLHRRLRGADHLRDNIWRSDRVETAFVLGVFQPKIYLPAGLSEQETTYILLHEQTHIRRGDHVVKLLSFLVLCVHWFNPLAWVAFFLSGRDMEMVCDEAVVRRLGGEVKKEYSTSLLALATGRRIVGGTPLAFGEGDTKGRVKNVLGYQKPGFWVVLVTALVVVALGVGFALNPVSRATAVDTIYTADLTPARRADLADRYELVPGSTLIETKFHVSDSIKSYVYYVELYQRGKLLGVCGQVYGNFDARDGSIVTAFSTNEDGSGLRWTVGMIDGGYATYPAIPFPDGPLFEDISLITMINEGNWEEMPRIVPEQPILLANIGMYPADTTQFKSYTCEYIMEHPETIAEYDCLYLVKCVFSELDETEFDRQQHLMGSVYDGYPTTFELYDSGGVLLRASHSRNQETATELPALLLKGTDHTVPSVNDTPQNTDQFLKITIGQGTDKVYFVYASDNRYWVERPYDYRRELEKETYTALMAYLETQPEGLPKPMMTLEKVKALAQRGEALSWSDFESFESVEIGSGLLIERYPLSDTRGYTLTIGGGGRETPPMYIRLARSEDPEDWIDIRTEDVDAFLR